MSENDRKHWTPQRKLQIVLESLQSDVKLAEVCRREGVSPNLVYKWRKDLLRSAETIFARKKPDKTDHRTMKLIEENQRMKSVIAEITAENLDLKKTLSD